MYTRKDQDQDTGSIEREDIQFRGFLEISIEFK